MRNYFSTSLFVTSGKFSFSHNTVYIILRISVLSIQSALYFFISRKRNLLDSKRINLSTAG